MNRLVKADELKYSSFHIRSYMEPTTIKQANAIMGIIKSNIFANMDEDHPLVTVSIEEGDSLEDNVLEMCEDLCFALTPVVKDTDLIKKEVCIIIHDKISDIVSIVKECGDTLKEYPKVLFIRP